MTSRERFLSAVACQPLDRPPVWIMRQAGRYLPEYRALRATAKGFLDLCYDPVRAAEITLQPITRFDVDAAILFSDILVVPHALGRRVDFVEGEGPRMDPIDLRGIERLDDTYGVERLAPVLDTVMRVRERLSPDKTLIGFCGAPWTVATYMIAGRGTPDQAPARAFAAAEPQAMERLIDTLAEVSAEYLIAQIRAGADVVQIFDTWAGVLDDDGFERWCVQPTAEIVRHLKANEPGARVIGFPKGIGRRLEHYAAETGVDGVGLDWSVPLVDAFRLQARVAVQGNLDPAILVTGGVAQDDAVDAILDGLGGGRFIFNLGHGVRPETPVENVARLVERVRRPR
jgi:uroporphyrinogen decarboxylase